MKASLILKLRKYYKISGNNLFLFVEKKTKDPKTFLKLLS